MFITFEGIDGSGKTTQIKLFSEYLKTKNIKHILTTEPRCTGHISWAEDILNVIFNNKMNPMSQLFLINAIRKEHIEKIIKPAIKRDEIVLCDRFIDSTIAYQSYGFGLNAEYIYNIHKEYQENLMSDVTFLFDMSIENSQNRIKSRGEENSFDKMQKDVMNKIRNGFIEQAKANLRRIIIIDANRSIDEINAEVIEKFTIFAENY